jgi:SPP1 gp7 family putative phage head morphogenesis protein
MIGLGKNFTKPYQSKFAVDYRGRVVHDSRRMALDAKPRSRSRESQQGVQSSIQIADQYRKQLVKLINEMNHSIDYWLTAKFKKTENQRELINPTLAFDTAAEELQKALNQLKKRWNSKFNQMAIELARYFSRSVASRSDIELKKILKKGGMSVEFKMTAPMREALSAIVHENVQLIKSIPQEYLGRIEQATMRSVAAGRDLHQLYQDIQKTYQLTKKRAELIARDQNFKATGQLQKVRFQELGIEEAIWRHSHAGREPRPSHVKNDGQRYKVSTGWFDPEVKQHITPGFLINCRCYSVPVLP